MIGDAILYIADDPRPVCALSRLIERLNADDADAPVRASGARGRLLAFGATLAPPSDQRLAGYCAVGKILTDPATAAAVAAGKGVAPSSRSFPTAWISGFGPHLSALLAVKRAKLGEDPSRLAPIPIRHIRSGCESFWFGIAKMRDHSSLLVEDDPAIPGSPHGRWAVKATRAPIAMVSQAPLHAASTCRPGPLPDIDGLDVARELRASGNRVPILILAARTTKSTYRRPRRAPMTT